MVSLIPSLSHDTVDISLELEHGQGTLTRDQDGNYDLKVLPGETITLICAPECVQGEYQWKRDSTVLYSSTNGVQMSESDSDHGRIRFEPGSPSRWDQVWRLVRSDLEVDDTFNYSCSSSLYGETRVDVTVTYAALGK